MTTKIKKGKMFNLPDLRPHCFHSKLIGPNREPVCWFVTPTNPDDPPKCDLCPNWTCLNKEFMSDIGVKPDSGQHRITLHDISEQLGLNPYGEGQTSLPHEYNPRQPPTSQPHDTPQKSQGDSALDGETDVADDGEPAQPPGEPTDWQPKTIETTKSKIIDKEPGKMATGRLETVTKRQQTLF